MNAPFAAYAQIQEWNAYKCVVDGVATTCDCTVDGVPTLKCLEVVAGNILFISSAIVVLVVFAMFITGSLQYLTSGGDQKKLEAAQGTFKYAIIGLLLFMGSYLILTIIDKLFLGGAGTLFRFEIPQFR